MADEFIFTLTMCSSETAISPQVGGGLQVFAVRHRLEIEYHVYLDTLRFDVIVYYIDAREYQVTMNDVPGISQVKTIEEAVSLLYKTYKERTRVDF